MEVEPSALHLRHRLWERRVPRERWAGEIARVVGCSVERARALLSHATPDTDERGVLVERFELDEHTFTFAPPEFPGDWVLAQNVAYLLESLKHGGKRRLAEHMGVDPATVSQWAGGRRNPRRPNLEALRHYFGLSSATDLEQEPLFLMEVPVTDAQRRRWLKGRLDVLEQERLKDLFPALERLLT